MSSDAMAEIFPAAQHRAADQLPADEALRFVLILQAFRKVQRCPGTDHSRFMRDVAGADPRKLTAQQRHYVMCCAWKYRRQMPPGLAPDQEPSRESSTGDENG